MTILNASEGFDTVPNQEYHDKNTLLYATSKMFERAFFYGVRALLLFYLIEGVFAMDYPDALSIFGLFASAVGAFGLLGALLGDLVIGNKKAIISGAILQLVGILCLFIPEINVFYIGLVLIVAGNGLYSPNIIANFGKLYLNKLRLLDAGYSILYLAINLGAALGVLAIGYLGEIYGWKYGFALAAVFSVFSLLPIRYLEKEVPVRVAIDDLPKNKIIGNIAVVVLLSTIFTGIYSILGGQTFSLENKLHEVANWGMPRTYWAAYTSGFNFLIAFICAILWTYWYSSQVYKLRIGFLFVASSVGLLLFIPESPQGQHVPIYLAAMFILSVAEVYIAPVIFSVVTQYSNPKYLASTIYCASFPAKILTYLVSIITVFDVVDVSKKIIHIILIVAIVCFFLAAIFLFINKKKAI